MDCFCSWLIFLMQLGFAMLEAGSVRAQNVQNVMFKNLMDVCIGTIMWFILGWTLGYSSGNEYR
eukprot:UN21877